MLTNLAGRVFLAPRRLLSGPQCLALLPAAALLAQWLGGVWLLTIVALGLPLYLWATGGFDLTRPAMPARDGPAEVLAPASLEARSDALLAAARDSERNAACLLLEVGGLDRLARHHGAAALRAAQDLCLERLAAHLRGTDRAHRIGDARFAVLVGPARRLDFEALKQLAARLQSAIEEPAAISEAAQYFTAGIGLAHVRGLPAAASGAALLEAAETTLDEARLHGASAIRVWSDRLARSVETRRSIRAEVAEALEAGQIVPWFQPQLCTSTGRISGVEALARWVHPERGVIAPGQFLGALEQAGRSARLGAVMLSQSLAALKSWDAAGLGIPGVSLNLSAEDLRNPQLVECIKWELDRYDLAPHRLGIEVLESVIAESRDCVTARNVEALTRFGCRIELDDFGTGQAPIATLQRMPVARIKIDRSFVARVDRDADQRRMLTAILSLAERLGIETLAEGVESAGEHALLAQLGCDHVQGFAIARPMPAPELALWTPRHNARIAETRIVPRKA